MSSTMPEFAPSLRQMLLALRLCHQQEQSDDFSLLIALYSVNDGSCHLLPPIPGPNSFGNMQRHIECVSLDGKVYALGGFKPSLVGDEYLGSSEVYAMDLAGEGEWKQCASMLDPRAAFGCGVINGNIYVFGGLSSLRHKSVFGGVSSLRPVYGSEVYDPVEDAWSPIAPMLCFHYGQKVTTVGEELFVHGGNYIHSQGIHGTSDRLEWARNEAVDLHVRGHCNQYLGRDIHQSLFAEVYRPLKNEWRIVEDFTEPYDNKILMVEGKLHKITLHGIVVYDGLSNSWIPLQSHLSGLLGLEVDMSDIDVAPLEDRIIALVRSDDMDGEQQARLMRSQRSSDKHKEIVWHEVLQCSLPPDCHIWSLYPCTIQL